MDYDITFDDSLDIFIVKTSGRMNGEDFINMAKEILGCSKWMANMHVIFDHHKMDFSKVSVENLERIRSFHKNNEHLIGSGKSGIIVGAGSLKKWFETWQNGEKIQAGNRVMVFEYFDEAIEWISCEKY